MPDEFDRTDQDGFDPVAAGKRGTHLPPVDLNDQSKIFLRFSTGYAIDKLSEYIMYILVVFNKTRLAGR